MFSPDPEEAELAVLLDLAGGFGSQRVLEIGSGDGRMTLRYAHLAAHVTGIDPDPDAVALAQASLPPDLSGRVTFAHHDILDGNRCGLTPPFDTAIFAWSL
jgi:predicted RNA methylase